MKSRIKYSHPYFAFAQYLGCTVKNPDGSFRLIPENQVAIEHYEPFELTITVINPYYEDGNPENERFKPLQWFDLFLSKQIISELENIEPPSSTRENEILDMVFLDKVHELKPDQVQTFLDFQFECFQENNKSGDDFLMYLRKVIEENPNPGNFKIKNWIDAKKPKANIERISSNSTETNQGSAKQIALAFYYLVKSEKLKTSLKNNKRNGKILEFFSGISYDNLQRKLGEIKNKKIQGGFTIPEAVNFQNDLKRVDKFFEDNHISEPRAFIKKDMILLKKAFQEEMGSCDRTDTK